MGRKKNTSGKEISNKTTSFQISKFGYRETKNLRRIVFQFLGTLLLSADMLMMKKHGKNILKKNLM